jgi:ribosomal protein L7Ae-like RNA K-turn-binding protein
MCTAAIKSGKAQLVIIAEDASNNTKKSVKNSCEYYNVSYIEYSNKEQLGHFCKFDALSALSINSEDFSNGIMKKLNEAAGFPQTEPRN